MARPGSTPGLFVLECFLVGDCKFLAALLAAAGKYAAAIGGCHTLAETVCVLALTAGRLIGPFHRCRSLALKTGLQRCPKCGE